MGFNIIDIEKWNRAKTYKHYTSDVPCTYSMCVNIDITKLKSTAKNANIKLFPTVLYGITHIVNTHMEFRMALDNNGNLGHFDVSHPCYTVFHSSTEQFTETWTEYGEDFDSFYKKCQSDIEESKKTPHISKLIDGTNSVFTVSCIPWTSFTAFNLNLQNGYDYFPPIFTIGKYFEDRGKLLLPLSIQVHHAVCDGFHTARFVNELQEWADSFLC